MKDPRRLAAILGIAMAVLFVAALRLYGEDWRVGWFVMLLSVLTPTLGALLRPQVKLALADRTALTAAQTILFVILIVFAGAHSER